MDQYCKIWLEPKISVAKKGELTDKQFYVHFSQQFNKRIPFSYDFSTPFSNIADGIELLVTKCSLGVPLEGGSNSIFIFSTVYTVFFCL